VRHPSGVRVFPSMLAAYVLFMMLCLIPQDRLVYRGMSNIKLPQIFLIDPDGRGRGGVEFGFLSCSRALEVAIAYLGKGELPFIFEISVGAIDHGGSLDWISMYPEEDEMLMPPMSFVEPTGGHRMVETSKGRVMVIPARINCNTKGKTIEKIERRRRLTLVATRDEIGKELQRDFRETCRILHESQVRAREGAANEELTAGGLGCEKTGETSLTQGKELHRLEPQCKELMEEFLRDSFKVEHLERFEHDDAQEYLSLHPSAKDSHLRAAPMEADSTTNPHVHEFMKRNSHYLTDAVFQRALEQAAADVGMVDLNDDQQYLEETKKAITFKAVAYEQLCKTLRESTIYNLEIRNKKGETALMRACAEGHVRTVDMLVQAGADITRTRAVESHLGARDQGDTCLHTAARFGHAAVVKILLKQVQTRGDGGLEAQASTSSGAQTSDGVTLHNMQNKNGRSALMEASARDRRDAVRQLLAAEGLNLNLQDATGRSALMEASQRGFFEIARRLLEHEADANLQGSSSGWESNPSCSLILLAW